MPPEWRSQLQGVGYLNQVIERIGSNCLHYVEIVPAPIWSLRSLNNGLVAPNQIDKQGRMVVPSGCINFLAPGDHLDEVVLVGDFAVGTVWSSSGWIEAKRLAFLARNFGVQSSQ